MPSLADGPGRPQPQPVLIKIRVGKHLQLQLLSKFSPEGPSEQTPQLTDLHHHGDL